MQTIKLDDYNIYVGSIWKSLKEFLANRTYSKYVIIVDENTKKDCLPLLLENVPILENAILVEIPSGEIHKNLTTCQIIWQNMMNSGADRKALTINLGGGVIGDMGGFCASTFKRGMDFIQIPTTLLSQVDASIGGKLGIDFSQVKNSVGVFSNPQAVFIDPIFLNTLSKAEIRSGFAEILKHSLIADASQWKTLAKIEVLDNIDWPVYLVPSLNIKKAIVTEDPFEKGLRKALNFGHTIGHAIEGFALETDRPLLHGEAIAIGMICESYLAYRQNELSEADLTAISHFILRIYDEYPLESENFDTFINLMKNDKKNDGNGINFTLIRPIGTAHINHTCSPSLIKESLEYYNGLLVMS